MAWVQIGRLRQDYPPLVIDDQIPSQYWAFPSDGRFTRIVALPSADRGPLDSKDVDLILIVPPDFRTKLDEGGRSTLETHTRESDERSRLAERRLREAVGNWKKRLQQVRLLRRGLPADFDDPLTLHEPRHEGGPLKRDAEELSDMLSRFLPFVLIMWALAGALYPAIDVCAGEKERGTLETLLLSPATRTEIVVGKFLAVWLFSAATAWWNFAWLGGAGWLAGNWLPFTVLRPMALLWCSLLVLLLAGLFSAVSLALGAYARSTKEGQYYLLPLFLVTMPLTFLPLVPGVELNLFFSLVPVTGATLLLQKLLSASPEPRTWLYFIPVLLSLAGSIALALWWAVAQFRREEVLFREGEILDLGAWLRRLLRRTRT
jgi:sodium transport system permease protein